MNDAPTLCQALGRARDIVGSWTDQVPALMELLITREALTEQTEAGQDATAAAKSLQSCPTPCDPIDGSPPGSPVPGVLQARTLEWVAISSYSA